MSKKTGKGSGAGTGKGTRIPKQIGSVKIPKELRRAGNRLLDQAQRPETQAKIAGVLSMAAGAVAAAAAAKRDRQPASSHDAASGSHAQPPHAPHPQQPPHPPQPPAPARPGQPGVADPDPLGAAIGQAVDGILGRVFGARPRS